MSLLDLKTVGILEKLLASSSKRPLRETSAQFAAVFPGGGATAFHALACLLAVLKDGPAAQWEDRLSGYHILLTAGSLVRGLRADTFDAFLIEAALAKERPPSHEAAFVRCLLLDSGEDGPIDGLTPFRWASEGGPLGAPEPCTQQQLRLALDRRRGATAESSDFGDLRQSGLPLLWRRLPPPCPLPAQPSELVWLSGNLTVLQGASRLDVQLRRVKDILAHGSQDALTPADAQEAAAALEADPAAARAMAPNPAAMPGLVRHNPSLAAQLLLHLVDVPQAEAHFQAAAAAEVGLQSLEVVSRLAQRRGPLPPGFLQMYLSNCFSSCEAEQDAAAAARRVRLVCVFLTALVRTRLPDVLPLLVEAQAFCIRFSRVREAAALFRMLKSLEGDDLQPEAA